MKKVFYLVLAAAALVLTVSCSSNSSSPGKAAKQYMEYMADGNYDKFIDGVYFVEGSSKEDIEAGKAMLKAMLIEKGKKSIDEKGGLKSVEIVSEEIASDGKTANVELKMTYGNDEVLEEDQDMILVDGKWLMDMNK